MIFVSVGSSTIPFDRLLDAVDGVSIDEPFVVQHGTSTIRPRQAECVDFLDFPDFIELVREARVVVTHAGVGSIITAITERKRPIVFPRRASHGEAVDDHQVAFARRTGELGLVTLVEDAELLAPAIADHAAAAPVLTPGRSAIEVELRSYLQECIGPAMPSVLSEGSRA
jgi:UDP-N-acetylglucosamine transferase subunit ALG13